MEGPRRSDCVDRTPPTIGHGGSDERGRTEIGDRRSTNYFQEKKSYLDRRRPLADGIRSMVLAGTEQILARRVLELELVKQRLGLKKPVDQGRDQVADPCHCWPTGSCGKVSNRVRVVRVVRNITH